MRRKIGAKPFLKWAGGKQALAATLIKQFPTDFSVYYEPFAGGGSVLLTLTPKRAVIGDSNSWLLDTYQAVRRNWKRVAQILEGLKNTREKYMEIRSLKPEEQNAYHRAAYLIYLNKTCFRGLFRVNRMGEFNVPYGAYNRRYYDPVNLKLVATRLRGVEIRYGDFELCVQGVSPRDFIYFDPPYFKMGGYSDFNRYTPGQFRTKDHIRLAALCRKLTKRKVRWALTNSNTPFITDLFNEFRIQRIATRREINLNSKMRNFTELLITNY